MSGATASDASAAYAPGAPERVRAQKEALAQWLARDHSVKPSTLPSGAPSGVSCGAIPVCDDLYLSEHRPIPDQPSSKRIWRELAKETKRARIRVGLRGVAGVAGPVGAVITAGLTGWEIGTALRPLFYGEDLPAPPAGPEVPTFTKWRAVTRGQVINSGSGEGYTIEIVAPEDGFIAQTASGSYTFAHVESVLSSPTCHSSGDAPSGVFEAVANFADESGAAQGGWLSDSANFEQVCFQGAEEVPVTLTHTIYSYFTESIPEPATDYVGQPTKNDYLGPTELLRDWPADVATWPAMQQKIADEVADHPARYPTLIQQVDHTTGGPSSDPLETTATVPSCAGDLYEECVERLANSGFLDTEVERATFTGADVEQPADAVIETQPAGGAVVDTSTTVTITANPDVEHMPVPAPNWIGQPLPAEAERPVPAVVTVLPEDRPDVRYGPSEVTEQDPAPGERVVPQSWPEGEPQPEGQPTEIDVKVNPENAPDPAAPGGLFTPPAVPPIDLSPLNQLTPCTVFPFGVACWVKGAMEEWLSTPITPSWHFEFPYSEDGFTVDLAMFDSIMPSIRAVLLFAAIGAMIWLFVGLAWGSISGGRGAEKD